MYIYIVPEFSVAFAIEVYSGARFSRKMVAGAIEENKVTPSLTPLADSSLSLTEPFLVSTNLC